MMKIYVLNVHKGIIYHKWSVFLVMKDANRVINLQLIVFLVKLDMKCKFMVFAYLSATLYAIHANYHMMHLLV